MTNLPRRQHSLPLVYDPSGQTPARELRPVPLDRPPFAEDGLQRLLAEHPALLPVGELEPAFAPLICLGREIETPSGALDVLFTSPEGYLTLVEVKLWHNPQARREVVGQILDYAKDFARWSVDELDAAVRKRNNGRGIPDLVREHDPAVDEAALADTITRNLRSGRVLLLIVGNGMREGVERIAEHLQAQPGLYFSLALVELALFHDEGDSGRVLVLPRTLARTVELTRTVVEVRNETAAQVDVHVPAPSVTGPGPHKPRRSITEEVFFRELAAAKSPTLADGVRSLMDTLAEQGAQPTWGRTTGVSMRMPDPAGVSTDYTVVAFTVEGQFWLGYLEYAGQRGYDPEIALRYLNDVMQLTGARRSPKSLGGTGSIERLLANREGFLALAVRYMDDLRRAAVEGARA